MARSLLVFAAGLFAFGGPSYGLALAAKATDCEVSATQSQDAPQVTSLNDQSDMLLQQAREFVQKGLLKEAHRTVREYLDKHSNSADGHFLLGYVLFKEQKAEASLAEYTEGAKYHDPESSDLKIVALDYVLLGDYTDADRWLTRSVEWNPKDPESWYYLGRTKYNENRFQEAVRAFEECLKLDPKNVKAEANLGLSLEGLGRINEAIAAYQSAIAWQGEGASKNPEPFIDLGNLLLERNQIEDAIAYLSQAREISPQESRTHESLGKAYLRLNELQEAQVELEKAVSLAPNSAPTHYMLGQVYRKRGLIKQAKLEFDRAAALAGTPSPAEKPNQ